MELGFQISLKCVSWMVCKKMLFFQNFNSQTVDYSWDASNIIY